MSGADHYENEIDDFLEGKDQKVIRDFILKEVDGLIASGYYEKYTSTPKRITWISMIVNDFFNHSKDQPFYEERCSIITSKGFKPVSNLYALNQELTGKFKSVENLFKKIGTPTAPISKMAIAIFGIDIAKFDAAIPEFEVSQDSPEKSNTIKKGRRASKKLVYMVLSIIAFLLLLLVLVKQYEPQGTVADPVFTVNASDFFAPPVALSVSSNVKEEVTLTVSDFAWRVQQTSNIPLDSTVIRITLKNFSDQPFFFDKLFIQTGTKRTLSKSLSVTSIDLIVQPGFKLGLEADKTDWNYSIKILKDNLQFLPANSQTTGLLLIKCKGNWVNESIEFTLVMEGQQKGINSIVSVDSWHSIGSIHVSQKN